MKRSNYEEYLEEQMKDLEFRAYYALAREKAHLEFSIEQLKEKIESNTAKSIIIRDLNKISKYIRHIAM
ncbi:MAG: hypothetical protein KIT33_06330 [Candidatus Kapabacteria bacterium]|nr:hypothetical protein [Ignavibacteriota bacterium]MCW5884571.1 hypothetical protein [Candidatus Kapabacteria bacterium]